MNTIIYAQALQDDGIDIWYLNKFIEKGHKEILKLKDFHARNEIFNSENNVKRDEETETEYIYNKNYVFIYLYSDEKAVGGRLSPIIIQSPFDDWEKIPDTLNIFLEKSKRHLSQKKLDVVSKAIEYAKKEKNIENKRKMQMKIGLILISTAAIAAFFFFHVIKK
jgi:hypothetical protein